MATIFNATAAVPSVFGTTHTFTIPAVTDGRTVIIASPPIGGGNSISSMKLGGVDGTFLYTLSFPTTSDDVSFYRWDNVTGAPTSVVMVLGANALPDSGEILETDPRGTAVIGTESFGVGGSVLTASITTPDTDSLIFGDIQAVAETITLPSGYSGQPASGSSYTFKVWNPTPGPAGLYSPVFDASAGNNWRAVLLAFPAAGGGAGNTIAWFRA